MLKIKMMNAIRQIIDVKNHSFNVMLPEDFNHQRVEVIILPSEQEDEIPQWQKDILDNRLKDFFLNPNQGCDFDEFCSKLEI